MVLRLGPERGGAERTLRAAGSHGSPRWGWCGPGDTGLGLSWGSPFSGSSQISVGFQSW